VNWDMNTTRFRTALLLAFGLVGCVSVKPERGAGQYVKLDYPASTASNELQIAVTYELWIPDSVRTLRASSCINTAQAPRLQSKFDGGS